MTALEPARAALLHSSDITRWGLGYVQQGHVLLSRHPRAVRGPFDFFEAVGNLSSDYIIGCASSDALKGNVNTQPYRYKHWMFAQESSIEDFASVRGELEAQMPAFLRRSIKGKAPAEVVFHLFLSLLHDSGQVEDPNLDPADVGSALRTSLAMVEQAVEGAGLRGKLGNLVVSNSRSMLAVRMAGPVFWRRLRQQEDPKRPDTEFRSVFVVGVDENPGEGFEELPPRSVLSIHRDVSTEIAAISAPPAPPEGE
jgi:glutamine amidotransferase